MGRATTATDAAILQAAREYRARGWSLIPLVKAGKLPRGKWTSNQKVRATEAELERWFAVGDSGIGVVLGEISGNLVALDFDSLVGYEAWAAAHPDLAKTLPTVATSRGRHVYARAAPEHLAEVRLAIGKPDGIGAILIAEGELRCGVGCYNVLPPSTHPSGHQYAWIIPPQDGLLPEVNVFTAGFLSTLILESGGNAVALGSGECDREYGEGGEDTGKRRLHKATDAITLDGGKTKTTSMSAASAGQHSEAAAWSDAVQQAIVDTLPEKPGQRHKLVFELARALKAIPELRDAPPENMKAFVQRWHLLAKDVIRTKYFSETWIDFLKAWPRVRFPRGEEPMVAVLDRANQKPRPKVAENYDREKIGLLVAICRELQLASGDRPFFLACRTAGRLLKVDHATANRWLFLLVHDGVLAEVEKGDRARRKASRYQYLAAM